MPQGNPFTSGVAPAAMAGLAPELVADQTALLRQQQLADLLRKQGMEPMGPTEMVSGWSVKKSPLEGVAKIAQALGGQYLASQADEKQAALAQAMQQRQMDSIHSIFGGAPADPNAAAQAVQKWGDANGDSGPPDPVLVQALQQRQQQAGAGGPSPQQRKVVEYAVRTGNNELLAKMLANFGEMTTDQKNWAATGQDPFEVGRQQAAERRTKGVFQLQPGTTSIDFFTGAERFQPKLGEGMMLNGGQVSAAPGYVDTNAEIAGRQAGAVASAQAGQKMITVPSADGTKMMTEAQAVEAAGGAPTNIGNMRPPGSSKGFQKFATPEEGLAAMDAQLKRYGDQGHNTLEKIIGRWSPPNENDTARLVSAASKRLGIDPKAPLDLGNPVVRQAVGTAIALQERPLLAHNGGAKAATPGIPIKGTQIPESAAKEQQSILEKVATAGSINADLAAIDKQIESKELKLGPLTNLAGQAKNYLGMSDANSRNLASFKATLEKLRNDSLRLNSGVQTEGDAQRAWKELIDNIGDEKLVRQRLQEIQKLNERGANLQQLQLDTLRKNFGAEPMSTAKAFNQPPAVGGGSRNNIDEILKKYGAQ